MYFKGQLISSLIPFFSLPSHFLQRDTLTAANLSLSFEFAQHFCCSGVAIVGHCLELRFGHLRLQK